VVLSRGSSGHQTGAAVGRAHTGPWRVSWPPCPCSWAGGTGPVRVVVGGRLGPPDRTPETCPVWRRAAPDLTGDRRDPPCPPALGQSRGHPARRGVRGRAGGPGGTPERGRSGAGRRDRGPLGVPAPRPGSTLRTALRSSRPPMTLILGVVPGPVRGALAEHRDCNAGPERAPVVGPERMERRRGPLSMRGPPCRPAYASRAIFRGAPNERFRGIARPASRCASKRVSWCVILSEQASPAELSTMQVP